MARPACVKMARRSPLPLKKTIAYGRVSTQSQADQGALERQERQLLQGVTADEVLVDVGSGKNAARPAYQRLLDRIATGQVGRVGVKEQDRLNRNLMADLELWQLCTTHGTTITDLHGREIEFRTPDGELLSTMVSAMNQHRSRAYGLKIQNGLKQARADKKPARPAATFPFGYRPVRNDKGQMVDVELDGALAEAARFRVDLFLEGASLAEVSRQFLAKYEIDVKPNGLSQWLRHPYLRGRLCWGSDGKGNFETVADEPTFAALITDAEADLIKARLAERTYNTALRNRRRRMFSNLCVCSECGYKLTYRVARDVEYLRCKHRHCQKRTKAIHTERIFQVLQYSIGEHAMALAPLLERPNVDPPQVMALQKEIETLRSISGTEELVKQKQAEIVALRSGGSDTPQWLVMAVLRNPQFWLLDDARINNALTAMGCAVTVKLGDRVGDARVSSVKFNTDPAEAPIPEDQTDIKMRRTAKDLVVSIGAAERIEAALDAIG